MRLASRTYLGEQGRSARTGRDIGLNQRMSAMKIVCHAERSKRRPIAILLVSLILLFLSSCSKKEENPQPVVTVQVRGRTGRHPADRPRRSNPVPAQSVGDNSQSRRTGKDLLCESRQSGTQAENCWRCWKTAISLPRQSKTKARMSRRRRTTASRLLLGSARRLAEGGVRPENRERGLRRAAESL